MSTKSGFTIVELLIVLVVGTILMVVIFGPLDSLYNDNVNSYRKVVQTTDTRGSLRQIGSEISRATAFVTALPTSSPYGPNDDGSAWTWTGKGSSDNNKRVLIIKQYATTTSSDDAPEARKLVYSTNSGCNTPLVNTIIFFVGSDNSLYKRTITDTSAACGTNMKQVQTCSAAAINNNADACPSIDSKIISNVSKFTTDYYPTATSTNSSNDPNNSQAVLLSITAGTNVKGVVASNSLRVPLGN